MKFSDAPRTEGTTLLELKNETDTVRLVILGYVYLQCRVQVWSGKFKNIMVEMCTYKKERAEEAIKRLQEALARLADDCTFDELSRAVDGVTRSYGGDPNDTRQMLDYLLEGKPKYWKDE